MALAPVPMQTVKDVQRATIFIMIDINYHQDHVVPVTVSSGPAYSLLVITMKPKSPIMTAFSHGYSFIMIVIMPGKAKGGGVEVDNMFLSKKRINRTHKLSFRCIL